MILGHDNKARNALMNRINHDNVQDVIQRVKLSNNSSRNYWIDKNIHHS